MKKAIQDTPTKLKKLLSRARKVERGEAPVMDRLTFTGHFTFEHFGDPPVAQDFRMQSALDETYQPLVRRMVVSAKETPIDTQWIPVDKSGLLILENRTGSGLLTNPTVEEWEDIKRQVVRVSYKGMKRGFLLRPGRIMVVEPEDVSELTISALDEPVNINLYLFSL